MINGLDLFSGIGGLSLALRPWVRPIAYCENERYAQAVLLSRIHDGRLARAPIWDDVTSLSGAVLPGNIDIIYGGFPCQDISVAGLGRGLVGERSGLYWQITRLVRETNPRFVFLENVPAIRTRGLNTVVQSLTELGYDCRWTIVSAQEVGAPHLRKRWFLLAHARGEFIRNKPGRSSGQSRQSEGITRNDGAQEFVADAESIRRFQRGDVINANHSAQSGQWTSPLIGSHNGGNGWWAVEPDVGRVANGVSQRVGRLRGLGNAVVPLQAQTAFKRLAGL